MRLLQGYLWHPRDLHVDLDAFLPREIDDSDVLWDEIEPPFAFFENGEPSAGQQFYQLTVLKIYEEPALAEQLHRDAEEASLALAPLLESTPKGVGWQLTEDLREL